MSTSIVSSQKTFSNAYTSYKGDLKRYSYFKVHNEALAEDMVQDTFMRTWTYLVKGQKIESMKAFLYHVLNNLIIDQYRKRKFVSLEALLENGFEPSLDETSRLMNAIDGRKTLLIIDKLPARCKRVVYLHYAKNLSLGEISEITKQSKNTVAVQINRGMKKLRTLYNDHK